MAVLSLYDYRAGLEIAALDPPFYALIMAAYRRADTANAAKLRAAWPDVVSELEARYHAPGGLLSAGEVRGAPTLSPASSRKNL